MNLQLLKVDKMTILAAFGHIPYFWCGTTELAYSVYFWVCMAPVGQIRGPFVLKIPI